MKLNIYQLPKSSDNDEFVIRLECSDGTLFTRKVIVRTSKAWNKENGLDEGKEAVIALSEIGYAIYSLQQSVQRHFKIEG